MRFSPLSSLSPCLLQLLLLLMLFGPVLTVAEHDLYATLGLSRTATDADIKRAYRKLSLKYHPDKNPDDEVARKHFMDIAYANEILSDPDKRQTYDLQGEEGLEQLKRQQEQSHSHSGMGSLFEQFFGSGSAAGGRRKGPDYRMDYLVKLEDLYNGATKPLKIARKVLCSHCRGTGAKDGKQSVCQKCQGRGQITQMQQFGPGFNIQMQMPCDTCGGRGKVAAAVCPVCGGSRLQMETKELDVVIERGMADGNTVVFERMSEQSPDSYPGDVVLQLRTEPHALFTRHGNDLYMEHEITLSEALLGFQHTFTHLDQRQVILSTGQEVSQPDSILVLKGEGMPIREVPSEKGDLHVKLKVKFPTHLSDEQQRQVKLLLEGE